ncbi:MAG: histone deacetylase [Acidobacteriota bacterium]
MIRAFSGRRCLLHEAPPGYPEVPQRLAGVLQAVQGAAWPVDEMPAHPMSREAVLALHDAAYVERFEHAVRRGDGLLDSADNPLGAGTWDAAWGAIDATLHAADWVLGGSGRVAFAAVRPPGHHAERDLAMGFCFFDNVAVAADHLRRRGGVERVAIFDFDVHHGNGTQHLFEERADVFYASTHQFPFYPGTGAASECGRGAGSGATLNVPLPAGSGDEEYAAALRERILPALREFAPQALLLSAGFDAWRGDPLGGMRVSEQAFEGWGRALGELAGELCDGRVLAVLEGGYDLRALPGLAVAHLRGLATGLGLAP